MSENIKESIDIPSQKNSEIQKENVRQDTVKQIGQLMDEIMIVIHQFKNTGLQQQKKTSRPEAVCRHTGTRRICFPVNL
jgi:hypothetical protein